MKFSKHQQRQAAKLNKRFPDHLVPMTLPPDTTPDHLRTGSVPMLGWRSSRFVVILWLEPNKAQRLSIQRADIDPKTGWCRDGISWDELQQVKSEAGFGDVCAVEVYPPDEHVVCDAPMRHLFLLNAWPFFMWKKSGVE